MKASDKKRESTRSTFKLLFYLNRSKAQKDGSMPIVCRISVDGKSESLSTGQKCRDEDWDKLLKMPKSKTKQKALQELRQQIENHYQGLLHHEGVVSASLLKVRVQQSEAPLDNLHALGTYELEQVRLSVGHTRSQVTYEHNRRVQQRLLDFIEKRGLSSDLRQIDLSFYEAYKLYLKGLGYQINHIQSHLSWLSRLMHLGVRKGSIRFNPFVGIKSEQVTPRPRYLHRGDIERLLSHPMQDQVTEQVRRLFLFSCFTGLASCDVLTLKYSDVSFSSSGQAYIRVHRQKTGVQSLIPLHPIAEQILKAQGKQQGLVFVNIPRKLTPHFRCIALACGLRENLTSHMARHRELYKHQIINRLN